MVGIHEPSPASPIAAVTASFALLIQSRLTDGKSKNEERKTEHLTALSPRPQGECAKKAPVKRRGLFDAMRWRVCCWMIRHSRMGLRASERLSARWRALRRHLPNSAQSRRVSWIMA